MIVNNIGEGNKYFKQFTCYWNMDHDQCGVERTYQIDLGPNCGKNWMQYYYIDRLRQEEIMYLLIWKEISQSINSKIITLQVKEIHSELKINLRFNHLPQFLVIVNELIYIVGTYELNIVSIQQNKLRKFALNNHNIQYMLPFFNAGQYGVVIYYCSSYNQYWYEQYTENGLAYRYQPSKLKIMKYFITVQTYTLKIVIPNLIGIGFYSSKHFGVINLQTMQMIAGTLTYLDAWQINNFQKCMVQYQTEKGIDPKIDQLIIGVGQINHLQFFKWSLRLPQQSSQGVLSFCLLDVIDWQNAFVGSIFHLHLKGFLNDFIIIRQVVILCYSLTLTSRQKLSQLFHLEHIEFSPIQMHEESLQKQYQSNQYHLIQHNLYPCNFMKTTLQNGNKNDSKKILFTWYKNYSFEGFVLYRDQFLIMRRNSISMMFEINKNQYLTNYRPYAQENQNENTSLTENKLQKWITTPNKIVTQEAVQLDRDKSKCIRYHELLKEIQQILQIPHLPQKVLTRMILFKKQATLNYLKDQIIIYCMELKQCYPHRQISNSCQDSFQFTIVQVIQAFGNLLTQEMNPKQQNIQSIDIMSLFYNQNQANLGGNIYSDAKYLLHLMWSNFLPYSAESFMLGQPTNQFLETLAQQAEHYPQQIKDILQILLSDCIDKIFLPMNFSLLKAIHFYSINFLPKEITKYLIKHSQIVQKINQNSIHNENAERIIQQMILINANCIKPHLFKMKDGQNNKIRHFINHNQSRKEQILKSLYNNFLSQFYQNENISLSTRLCDDKNIERQRNQHSQRKDYEKILELQEILFKRYCRQFNAANDSWNRDRKNMLLKCNDSFRRFKTAFQQLYKTLPSDETLLLTRINSPCPNLFNKPATQEWMGLLQSIPQIQSTNILKNIAFIKLKEIIQSRNLEELQKLLKYFSRQQLSEYILNSVQLRTLYNQSAGLHNQMKKSRVNLMNQQQNFRRYQ